MQHFSNNSFTVNLYLHYQLTTMAGYTHESKKTSAGWPAGHNTKCVETLGGVRGGWYLSRNRAS